MKYTTFSLNIIIYTSFHSCSIIGAKLSLPQFFHRSYIQKGTASAQYLIADDDIKCYFGLGVIDSIYYTIIHYKLNRRNTLKFSDSMAIHVIIHLGNTYELDMVSEKEMNKIF